MKPLRQQFFSELEEKAPQGKSSDRKNLFDDSKPPTPTPPTEPEEDGVPKPGVTLFSDQKPSKLPASLFKQNYVG